MNEVKILSDDDDDDELDDEVDAAQQHVKELGLGSTAPSHIDPNTLWPEVVADIPSPVLPPLLHLCSHQPPAADHAEDISFPYILFLYISFT